MRITAQQLLISDAVTIRTNPMFKWSSGIEAPIYTDNRILLSSVRRREIVKEELIQLFKDIRKRDCAVAAVATAGIPWGTMIANELGVPFVYVRSSKKDHGKEASVEGKVQKGREYIVIEDLFSTGKSAIKAACEVRAVGGIVEKCMSIFSYNLPLMELNFIESKLETFSLTNLDELLEEAIQRKEITPQQKLIVEDWRKK